MLRGHAIGGSRRLNGHWQSGGQNEKYKWESSDLWTPIDVTEGYGSLQIIRSTTSDFVKNTFIPDLKTLSNYGYFNADWVKVEIEVDYNTKYIVFDRQYNYGDGIQRRHYTPYFYDYSGSNYNTFYLSSTSRTLTCDAGPDDILDKSITPLTPSQVTIWQSDSMDSEPCFLTDNKIIYYTVVGRLQTFNPVQTLPNTMAVNNFELTDVRSANEVKIKAKIVSWREVLQNGYWI